MRWVWLKVVYPPLELSMQLVLGQVQVSLGPAWPEVTFLGPPGCDVKQLCAMPPQPCRKGRIPPAVPPPQGGEVS